MRISVTLNMQLQRFLKLNIKNSSVRHIRNLYNLRQPKDILPLSPSISTHADLCYLPSTFNSIYKFSTTNLLSKSKDRVKEKKKSAHVDLNEIAEVTNVDRLLSQFDQAVEDFKDEMIKHVGLRTSIGAIEELIVKYDGDEYELQELVEISRKPKLIVMNISTFPQIIPDIIDALAKSQMNLNPQQEGTTLYISIPKVTKEHRENLAKRAKAFFVKCKDNITDVRNKHVKDVKKKVNAPSDLVFRVEGYISTLSNQYIDKAKQLLEAKQKELLHEE